MFSLNRDLLNEAEFMNGKIDNKNRKIICLSGPRACGKSTISDHLVHMLGYEKIAFADPLREIAAVYSEDLQDNRLFLSELGKTVRSLLPDFLIQVVKNKIKYSESHLVIEDIRFLEELEYCKSINATTVRLEISTVQQLLNLKERGSELSDAFNVIECEDEKILDSNSGWDYILPAIGKFEDIAIQLDYLTRG